MEGKSLKNWIHDFFLCQPIEPGVCKLLFFPYENSTLSMEILIKNMVCPRCIEAVSEIFSGEKLEAQVELGKVRLGKSISEAQKEKLAQLLQNRGFELLESGKSALISKIKTGIIDLVHHQDNQLQENLSSYLSEKLNQEYSGLSKLFRNCL